MKSIKRKFNLLLLLYLRSKGIRNYLSTPKTRKLHLGAGPNIIDGWLNTDVDPKGEGVYFLDVSKRFPVQAYTFDYILSEHLIEHFTYQDGLCVLKECYRVLKPGGTIRIATPDIDKIISLRAKEKNELQNRYIKWHIDNFLPGMDAYNDCFVINNAFRGWGHQFIYDEGTLRDSMHKAGFVEIRRYKPGESDDETFTGIEWRAKDEVQQYTALVLEANRPEIRP